MLKRLPIVFVLIYKSKSWTDLCLAHIKISVRAIKILRVGRPIYQVWLSQIGRWRAFTLKISWELVCFASVGHRPFIARQSGDYWPMIGRPVPDKYIYVHAYWIIILAFYTGKVYLMLLHSRNDNSYEIYR